MRPKNSHSTLISLEFIPCGAEQADAMLLPMNWIKQLDEYGRAGTPCLFILDFELKKPLVLPLNAVNGEAIRFNFRGMTNSTAGSASYPIPVHFNATPPDFQKYRKAFDLVMAALQYGNSYLLNLTFPTRLETNLDLSEIFNRSKAPYRLWLKDRCVVFSPECFVRIENDEIATFPMKGTIDADLPDAAQQLLENRKELAEHYTIVDLLRNDLSQIAEDVRVERFRYIERVSTIRKPLLQTSSEIRGKLPENWQENLGTMLSRLLPAGSISGAPKEKTVEIIQQTEGEPRGYYTGVCGVFDGTNLDSAIMIRFIEKRADGLWFRSGGGITVNSVLEDEYRELVDKVYLPFKGV